MNRAVFVDLQHTNKGEVNKTNALHSLKILLDDNIQELLSNKQKIRFINLHMISAPALITLKMLSPLICSICEF